MQPSGQRAAVLIEFGGAEAQRVQQHVQQLNRLGSGGPAEGGAQVGALTDEHRVGGQRVVNHRASGEHGADLEDTQPGGAGPGVGSQGVDQSGEQRGPQHRLLGHQRIDHAGRAQLGQPEAVEVGGGQERQRRHLGEAAAHQRAAQQPGVGLGGAERPDERRGDRRPGEGVVALEAGHLLDQVDLAGGVRAPRWHGDLQRPDLVCGDLEADRTQVLGDASVIERPPGDAVHLVGAQRDHGGLGGIPRLVDHAGVQLGAGVVDQQLRGAKRGQRRHRHIGAPSVAGAGFGVHVEPVAAHLDALGPPPGQLQEHVGGRGADLGRCSTHHPGDAHRSAGAVCDHAVAGAERAGDPVQGLDRFAVAPVAHHQLAVRHLGQVVGVAGLAELQHDVVGHVDHRRDRPHAGSDQALGHPPRRLGRRVDARQHPGDEAPAQVDVIDAHRRQLGRIGARRGHPRVGQGEGHPEVGGQVAGHPGHRQRVGAVGLHLQLDDHLGAQAERLAHRGAEGQVAAQVQDALVVVAEAQFLGRAEHAVGPFAAHLAAGDLHAVGHHRADRRQRHQDARLQVGGAAGDLQRLPVAGVDVDQADAVGVGVGPDVEHLGNDDALQVGANRLDRLDRQAQAAARLGDQRRVVGQVGELGHPGQNDSH